MNKEKTIKKEDIIKIFFKGMDMRKYSNINIDKQIDQIKNIVTIWENNKNRGDK
jgi:hypothetical protein